jgi:drug/metabolite transporter (DMT)-like permease
MNVEHMVLYRFLFACVGMAPVIATQRVRLTAAETRTLLLAAAFGIPIQFLMQFHGLVLTTVSHASLMVGAMPVLLAAAAALFAGERLDWVGWLALCGSTIGAAMVVLGGSHVTTGRETPSLAGDLLVIVSLIAALAWILLSKKLMQTHSPPLVTACTIYSGTVMLVIWMAGLRLVASLMHRDVEPMPFAHVSATAWMALAISGLLCTATTTLLWNWGIHHVPASRAGVFLNIEPALGSVLGVELLGERLGPYAWLGGALILAAAITLTTRAHEPEPAVILE